MTINPADPRSPSRQIADDIRARITSGDLAPGAPLPSERVLVETYGTAAQTARQAIAHLKAEGLVVGIRGRGVFVREKPPITRVGSERFAKRHRESGRSALQAEAEAAGRTWRQEIRELAEVPAPPVAAQWFGIDEGATVFVRRRRTWIDDFPTQLADSYYELATVEGTAIREEDTGPGGSFARLEEAGHRIVRFREELNVRMPTPEETRDLRLAPGTPVVDLVRVVFGENDRVLEVFTSVMAGDRHTFAYEFDAE